MKRCKCNCECARQLPAKNVNPSRASTTDGGGDGNEDKYKREGDDNGGDGAMTRKILFRAHKR